MVSRCEGMPTLLADLGVDRPKSSVAGVKFVMSRGPIENGIRLDLGIIIDSLINLGLHLLVVQPGPSLEGISIIVSLRGIEELSARIPRRQIFGAFPGIPLDNPDEGHVDYF